jgi:DNA-binding CsgD family transcriptional regulator
MTRSSSPKTHLRAIFRTLDAKSREEAVIRAVKVA